MLGCEPPNVGAGIRTLVLTTGQQALLIAEPYLQSLNSLLCKLIAAVFCYSNGKMASDTGLYVVWSKGTGKRQLSILPSPWHEFLVQNTHQLKVYSINKWITEEVKIPGRGWRDGSEVKSTDYSSRGPGFNSQQQHGGSQPSVMGSNALFWCVWRQLQRTHVNKKKERKEKKRKEEPSSSCKSRPR